MLRPLAPQLGGVGLLGNPPPVEGPTRGSQRGLGEALQARETGENSSGRSDAKHGTPLPPVDGPPHRTR